MNLKQQDNTLRQQRNTPFGETGQQNINKCIRREKQQIPHTKRVFQTGYTDESFETKVLQFEKNNSRVMQLSGLDEWKGRTSASICVQLLGLVTLHIPCYLHANSLNVLQAMSQNQTQSCSKIAPLVPGDKTGKMQNVKLHIHQFVKTAQR